MSLSLCLCLCHLPLLYSHGGWILHGLPADSNHGSAWGHKVFAGESSWVRAQQITLKNIRTCQDYEAASLLVFFPLTSFAHKIARVAPPDASTSSTWSACRCVQCVCGVGAADRRSTRRQLLAGSPMTETNPMIASKSQGQAALCRPMGPHLMCSWHKQPRIHFSRW